MHALRIALCLLIVPLGLAAAQDKKEEKKESVAKVKLGDLGKDPGKYAGKTVQLEGVLDETPKAKNGIATLWIDRSDVAITCEGKPDMVAGDRVRVVALCEYAGKPAKLKLRATSVEKIPEQQVAVRLTTAELLKDAKKYDGKVIELEGMLRDTPEAVEFMGELRYSPRLCAGLQVVCRGKPANTKGDWVRITGTLSIEDNTFSPLVLEATLVEKIPPRPAEVDPKTGPGVRPKFPRP
jgi:hypothetical protein